MDGSARCSYRQPFGCESLLERPRFSQRLIFLPEKISGSEKQRVAIEYLGSRSIGIAGSSFCIFPLYSDWDSFLYKLELRLYKRSTIYFGGR